MKETEQARTRRRWITLGEVVGICALIVSGLSYWDSHTERAATAKLTPAAVRAGPLVLTGTVDQGATASSSGRRRATRLSKSSRSPFRRWWFVTQWRRLATPGLRLSGSTPGCARH